MQTTHNLHMSILALVCALARLLMPGPVFGAPVGTGSFSGQMTVVIPFTTTDASLTFEPMEVSSVCSSGVPVNLGITPGSMTFDLVVTNFSGSSGVFEGRFESSPPTVLSFDVPMGDFLCAESCFVGVPTSFVGGVTNLTGSVGLPPDVVYTFDGSGSATGLTGMLADYEGIFALNAFCPVDTPTGSGVTVSTDVTFFDPQLGTDSALTVDVTYESVSCPTGDCTTVVTAVSNAAGEMSSNFAVEVGDYNAAYFDVSTTADLMGAITVCGSYSDLDGDGFVDDTDVDELTLALLHRENGVFVDVTVSRDPDDDKICGDVATLSPFVLAVNLAAPEAGDDDYATYEDTELSVVAPGVLGNDTGTGGDPLTASLVTNPGNGTLIEFLPDGSFAYIPDPNFFGEDQFTYEAHDAAGNADTATVRIDVEPVNDAPLANDDAYTTDAHAALSVPAPGVLGNDTDVDTDGLTAILVSDVSSGVLTLSSDGSFLYTPAADSLGEDTFTYKANDGLADSDNTATVTITMRHVPPEDQVQDIHDEVTDLLDSGLLNRGQGNSLTSKLDKVRKRLSAGRTKGACNALKAFLNHVASFVDEGVLSAQEGQVLIAKAVNLRLELGCR